MKDNDNWGDKRGNYIEKLIHTPTLGNISNGSSLLEFIESGYN